MRMTDIDALISKIEEHMPLSWTDSESELQAVSDYHTYLTTISTAATIDAVPVVRGEWIEAKSGVMSVWPPGQVMCSVCERRMPSQWKKMPPYCYGCGAKMEDKPCG